MVIRALIAEESVAQAIVKYKQHLQQYNLELVKLMDNVPRHAHLIVHQMYMDVVSVVI
jgi:hypothetical protein